MPQGGQAEKKWKWNYVLGLGGFQFTFFLGDLQVRFLQFLNTLTKGYCQLIVEVYNYKSLKIKAVYKNL